MNAPLSRRSLLGASTAAIGAVSVAGITTPGQALTADAALSPADARLVALADAYEVTERACAAHTAAVRGLADEDEDGFHRIARHLVPMENEAAELPADTLAGVVAKARLCQARTVRDCETFHLTISLADDVWRLFGPGAAA